MLLQTLMSIFEIFCQMNLRFVCTTRASAAMEACMAWENLHDEGRETFHGCSQNGFAGFSEDSSASKHQKSKVFRCLNYQPFLKCSDSTEGWMGSTQFRHRSRNSCDTYSGPTWDTLQIGKQNG